MSKQIVSPAPAAGVSPAAGSPTPGKAQLLVLSAASCLSSWARC